MPMTFGQILDRIFRLLKSDWRPFIGIGVFPFGLFLLLYGAFFAAMFFAGFFPHPPAHPDPHAILLIALPVYLLMLLVMFPAYGMYYGASTFAALHADQDQPATTAQSFRHAWSKLGRYTWLMFLRSIIIAAPILAFMAVVAIGALVFTITSNGNPNPGLLFLLIPLAILLYLGGIVYAVLMSLRYALAFPACVQENLTAAQALKRSALLTEDAKGRIFLVALVIYAISYAGLMILYIVFAIVAAIVGLAGAGNWQHMGPVSYIVLGILALLLLAVLMLYVVLLMAAYSAALAVQYRDQCLRKDPPPIFAPIK